MLKRFFFSNIAHILKAYPDNHRKRKEQKRLPRGTAFSVLSILNLLPISVHSSFI
ncbi:hypothetical protein ACIQZI_22645 [Peribacillus sp. NPDC096379]|uniref:hypothetical protein n=1 Tax=Peribacillus sp. NPDC096379 TaxID=3364393 RepID=UPI00380967AC